MTLGKHLSPFNVCVFPPPARNGARTCTYPQYIHEILAAAGLFYNAVEHDKLVDRLPDAPILLTIGDFKLADDAAAALEVWVKSGGCWISIAGVCGLEALFGVKVAPPAYGSWGGGKPTLGEGFLQSSKAHKTTGHLRIPLHYFNGIPVNAANGEVLASVLDAHGRKTDRIALARMKHGDGCAILIAPDLVGSIVRIQQGICVTRDGVSASDGTAPVTDDVLKSDDGCVLDWILDRQPVPGVPGLQAFTEPIADLWRELLLRTIFFAAEQHNVALPLLWLYPRNLSAIAHFSLDTDNNVPEQGQLMLEMLNSEDVKATWCTILPGYSREFTRQVAADGHELAMHFDAMTEGLHFTRAEFARQWRGLVDLFDGVAPVSNKNHYTRWEGDCEFWEWCEAHQIQLDQSKGASKTGESGYNFGTCRPYFPVDTRGRIIPVFELPTPVQDLTVFGPVEILDFLLDAVTRTHGILHMLYHPAHIDKPSVQEASRHTIRTARDKGLEWWTAQQINSWERARRSVQWSNYQSNENSASVSVNVREELEGANVLWLAPENMRVSVVDKGEDQTGLVSTVVTRWGFEFRSVNMRA